jgi:hypothetical protein
MGAFLVKSFLDPAEVVARDHPACRTRVDTPGCIFQPIVL